MERRNPSLRASLVAATALTLGASGLVLADDSSMSMWTGDSYAYFNNLDYSLGKFNVARAPLTHDEAPLATTPRRNRADKPVMIAGLPRGRAKPTNPFRDDTGA